MAQGGGLLTSAEIQAKWLARLAAPLVITVVVSIHGSLAVARGEGKLENALQIFIERPQAVFLTLETTLLFAVGIAASILAWVKGLSAFGDPDPGRARVYKRSVVTPLRELEYLASSTVEAIYEIEEGALAELDVYSDQLQELQTSHAETVSAFQTTLETYHDHVAQTLERIDRKHEAMIALYTAIAAEEPAPFRRIDRASLLELYRIQWSPPVSLSKDDAMQEIGASRSRIVKAAAEAKSMISTSLVSTTKEKHNA